MNMDDPALHKDASISSPLKEVDEPWYPNVSASVFHLGTFFLFQFYLFRFCLCFFVLMLRGILFGQYHVVLITQIIFYFTQYVKMKKFASFQIHHIFFFRPKTKRKWDRKTVPEQVRLLVEITVILILVFLSSMPKAIANFGWTERIMLSCYLTNVEVDH